MVHIPTPTNIRPRLHPHERDLIRRCRAPRTRPLPPRRELPARDLRREPHGPRTAYICVWGASCAFDWYTRMSCVVLDAEKIADCESVGYREGQGAAVDS